MSITESGTVRTTAVPQGIWQATLFVGLVTLAPVNFPRLWCLFRPHYVALPNPSLQRARRLLRYR